MRRGEREDRKREKEGKESRGRPDENEKGRDRRWEVGRERKEEVVAGRRMIKGIEEQGRVRGEEEE